jgi:hypothetical protein
MEDIMASPKQFSQRAWKWTLLLLGVLWVSFGCGPVTLFYFLSPFSDDRIAPKCKLAASKEVTVCILTSFATLETRPESLRADDELAELFAQQLRKRCEENREKIKVVPPAKVRDYKRHADFATRSTHDIGKHFQADYVISLEISNLTIYEKGSSRSLFRGAADVNVQVVDVNKPAGEGTIFSELHHRDYPTNGPRDASELSPAQFRNMFLSAVAADLCRMFTAYPKEQRLVID